MKWVIEHVVDKEKDPMDDDSRIKCIEVKPQVVVDYGDGEAEVGWRMEELTNKFSNKNCNMGERMTTISITNCSDMVKEWVKIHYNIQLLKQNNQYNKWNKMRREYLLSQTIKSLIHLKLLQNLLKTNLKNPIECKYFLWLKRKIQFRIGKLYEIFFCCTKILGIELLDDSPTLGSSYIIQSGPLAKLDLRSVNCAILSYRVSS